MTVFLFVSLLVMLAASVPIFIALCGSVTASFLLFSNMDTTIIIQRMFAGINKFSLMSIPLFVLAANLMSEGGISKRIINLANAFVGHIPGGLGMTAILASMFFGAISGSSPATVVAIGALLYPAMIEKGYSKEFSAGVFNDLFAGQEGIHLPQPSAEVEHPTRQQEHTDISQWDGQDTGYRPDHKDGTTQNVAAAFNLFAPVPGGASGDQPVPLRKRNKKRKYGRQQ